MNWQLIWEPHLPVWLIASVAVLAGLSAGYALYRRARGARGRVIMAAVLLATLANPTVREEQRDPVPDVAAIVLDRSPSQKIGARTAETQAAYERLRAELARYPDLEVRTVPVEANRNRDSNDGTALFTALETTMADVPPGRFAGAILITDGQVHDVPAAPSGPAAGNAEAGRLLGHRFPIHGLIVGRKGERDRKLTIEEAPRFGIVGEPVTLAFRVEDGGDEPQGTASVSIRVDGTDSLTTNAPIGQRTLVQLVLEHGGPNVIEIDAEPGDHELTLQNNRAVVIANGIRDRLRVLLVSGEPHPGERTWRNLLKADPSVDLVHFTILRPPEKQDGTPISELSLIAFPTRELFSLKLDEFDLIIFDRYRRRGVLPLAYLGNVARYVENGGAILIATGPAFASPYSIYRTPLAAILPAQPTGAIVEQGYRAQITKIGERHPVTADLPGAHDGTPTWGRWFRLIEVEQTAGDMVMSGPGERPLMLLNRVGDGRVAQLMSDHAWLWTRGFEGGGPQAELLRRLAHWLMKEPDLEEENLSAEITGGTLTVTRRSMQDEVGPGTLTFPSGRTAELAFEQIRPGRWHASLTVDEAGLYRMTQGKLSAVTAVGPLNPKEFSDVRATGARLAPIAAATGGGIFWVGENATNTPGIRRVRAGRDTAGSNWLGLQRNEQYLVRTVRQTSLITGPFGLLLLLGGLVFLWRREGG